MIFYTADLHLGHKNIIHLSNRPFSSVEQMNETLINNINETINPDDDLYILGDFSFKGGNPVEYLSKMNGIKHLIIGNHDNKLLLDDDAKKMFVEITPYTKIKDKDRDVILCHYPIAEWDGYFRGAYHLFGHVHNNFENPWYNYMSKLNNCWNVGVDVRNFYPVTLDDLIEKTI